MLLRLLFSCSLLCVCSTACSLPPDVDVVVYADEAGGVGKYSHRWTRAFFSWLAAANQGFTVAYVTAQDMNTFYGSDACVLADEASYPDLRLYVQPGGAADNQSSALGPGGRDNILDFVASERGHFMGTCAGQYYAAGTYWWAEHGEALPGKFFPNAWQPHWLPTVEGPIQAIADYPDFAPTLLSNGLTQIYWGGPARGQLATTTANPNGGRVLSTFADPAVPVGIPATWTYSGTYVRALLHSPHPEAQAGVGIACQPPLPPGCITEEQQLANWRNLAADINALVGWDLTIPKSLRMPSLTSVVVAPSS